MCYSIWCNTYNAYQMATTIVYELGKDDLDYGQLIGRGVLDNTGRVAVWPCRLEILNASPIYNHVYVRSGRGYFDAWKSNLQKMIRRGCAKAAADSFLECAACEGKFLSNIMNRLCHTIPCEDIGIANPKCAAKGARILSAYEKTRGAPLSAALKKDCVAFIQSMCAGYKSRLSDNIFCVLNYQGQFDLKYETCAAAAADLYKYLQSRDYVQATRVAHAMLQMSKAGVQMKTGGMHKVIRDELFKRKKKLVYDIWAILIHHATKAHMPNSVSYINELAKLFMLKDGEDTILLLICAILSICIKCAELERPAAPECVDAGETWIADVSYDCHTYLGRQIGRDKRFFMRYCCKLDAIHPDLYDLEQEYYNLFTLIWN
jgi:hypothetical protein